MVKQDVGIAILGIASIFGAWSAWNSSYFTAATFVDTEQKYKDAKTAMNLGLLTGLGIALGLYLVYGKKGLAASAAGVGTTVLLYGVYEWRLRETLRSRQGQDAQRNAQQQEDAQVATLGTG